MTDKPVTTAQILKKASDRALQGGLAGAAAMGINVLSLMWMRTTINYQYRHGTTTTAALKHLYKEGGVRRFYRGLAPALLQGPLSRFGDTAANTGVLAFLDQHENTKSIPVAVKTGLASLGAALFRIFLMPIDTLKTVLQVEGKPGLNGLWKKTKTHGPQVFYHGAIAASAATFVGHYPWFATFNILQEAIPKQDTLLMQLSRNALIGFCASAVSDTCSNSIRVVKVYKQSNFESVSYPEAVRQVIKADGLAGLFGRGLKTKIIANGMQGLMFSVLWKAIDDHFVKKKN